MFYIDFFIYGFPLYLYCSLQNTIMSEPFNIIKENYRFNALIEETYNSRASLMGWGLVIGEKIDMLSCCLDVLTTM